MAAFVLGLTGAAVRLRNAWRYDIDMGFDAPSNWAYVEALRSSWVPRR